MDFLLSIHLLNAVLVLQSFTVTSFSESAQKWHSRGNQCSSEWKELEQYFYLPQCENLPSDIYEGKGL